MFQVGKSMEDLNEKISETEKTEINSKVEKLREAYDRKDIPEVKTLTEEVNKKFQDISQNLYSSTNENKDVVNDQDFESVDFEEVK
jgi:molecular chaperone DnaK